MRVTFIRATRVDGRQYQAGQTADIDPLFAQILIERRDARPAFENRAVENRAGRSITSAGRTPAPQARQAPEESSEQRALRTMWCDLTRQPYPPGGLSDAQKQQLRTLVRLHQSGYDGRSCYQPDAPLRRAVERRHRPTTGKIPLTPERRAELTEKIRQMRRIEAGY